VQTNGSNTTSPLFTTYGSNLDFSTGLSDISRLAWEYLRDHGLPIIAGAITRQDYQQIVSDAQQLAGTFNTALGPASDGLMDYLTAFVKQAAYQHTNSYPIILNVPSLLNDNIIVRS
jgi:hypothetical protein